jgi:hypothetical protein
VTLGFVILLLAFLSAAWVSSGGRAGSRVAVTTSATDPSADYWHKRYSRMKRYARSQEKLRGVQYREILKLRALVPQPFWVPAWFKAQALCIHRHESTDWHQKGHHRGGLQFLFSTWASVGGRGDPANASPAEQIYRAFLVWKRDGGSWAREWTTAGACGLA